jgi:SAM-dependent methyltransferase
MSVLRRTARVVADEGVAGLARRIGGKIFRPDRPEPHVERDAARQEYKQQARAFHERTRALGHERLENYYWYHTIDLGNGLITPGVYDFRPQLPVFGFPDRMAGMRVLDVGSATGFFTFEFERRGAEVVSVELPSLAAWDMLDAERDEVIRELIAWHKVDTAEQAYDRHLDGPFRFCQSVLGSGVKRCYSSVYDLTLAKLGGETFDLIFAGDVLLHLFSPLKALDVLAGLCRGSLVVTIDAAFPGPAHLPMLAFLGDHRDDQRAWWIASVGCVEAMLKRLGFGTVSVVGRHSGLLRPDCVPYAREVIWSWKTQPSGKSAGTLGMAGWDHG